jgi:hypothetical protein
VAAQDAAHALAAGASPLAWVAATVIVVDVDALARSQGMAADTARAALAGDDRFVLMGSEPVLGPDHVLPLAGDPCRPLRRASRLVVGIRCVPALPAGLLLAFPVTHVADRAVGLGHLTHLASPGLVRAWQNRSQPDSTSG